MTILREWKKGNEKRSQNTHTYTWCNAPSFYRINPFLVLCCVFVFRFLFAPHTNFQHTKTMNLSVLFAAVDDKRMDNIKNLLALTEKSQYKETNLHCLQAMGIHNTHNSNRNDDNVCVWSMDAAHNLSSHKIRSTRYFFVF